MIFEIKQTEKSYRLIQFKLFTILFLKTLSAFF
ncbi:hypothetical protein N198_08010 [Helicobacter pylori UM037]|uniref:Uncharacterized protein n=1 Tax=Helicobacter pylori UM037 TaxID=1321939 RepID=A0AB33Z752_HELPX|nr:hypothetical protein N198_08010 [Helicobacter pylori UM037]